MVTDEDIQLEVQANDEFQSLVKGGNYAKEARMVLKVMQQRDYKLLDLAMDCAKDVNIKDMSFGRMALDIPIDHYEVLKLIYPDITCPDAEIKKKAWQAFAISDESLPYRPNKLQRKM